MKNTLNFFLLSLVLLITVSCRDTNPMHGEWKLTSWYIGIETDLNEDAIKSSNLLDEIDCENKEILTIKPDGTINSINTYSPIVKISKINNQYSFDVKCSNGRLGFASSYRIVDDKIIIEANAEEYLYNGKQLTRVFKNVIKVYDSSFTKVIETKDLTLNYVK